MNEIMQARVEVERELQIRRHVYPRLVEQGKLTGGEAERRMKALAYVLYLLDESTGATGCEQPPTTGE